MPKRTNEFQQLTFAIQKYLANDATVTESKFLIDQTTGKEVEVDIVIESVIGGYPITIGIECTGEKRPASTEWINEIYGKHFNLPINKTVLVSKSGFRNPAKEKARFLGIDFLSLEDAQDAKWLSYVKNHKNQMLGSFIFEVKSWKVIHQTPRGPKAEIGLDSLITEILTGKSKVLGNHLNDVMRDKEAVRDLINIYLKSEKKKRKPKFGFNLDWSFNNGATIMDAQGRSLLIRTIKITGEAKVVETQLILQPGKIGETHFAYGTAENIFEVDESLKGKALVTIFESDGKPTQGILIFPTKSSDDGKKIICLESGDGKEKRS